MASLSRWFFGHFFQILLVLVCASQWVTGWWLLTAGTPLPYWTHAAGILLLWLINVRIARGSDRFGRNMPAGQIALRLYVATAFASVFAFAFLALASSLRWLWLGIESVLFAQSTGVIPAPIDSGAGFVAFTHAGILLIGFTFLYGYTIGQSRLRVRTFDVPVADLPPSLDGVRVAHISDIHMGQNLEPDQLAAYVERVNQLDPDLICITGDMIDSARTDMDLFLPIFAELRARFGVYAILGNHDHAAGAERVVAALQRHTRFVVMRDEQRPVSIRGGELHIIGLDDRGVDWARGIHRDPHLDSLFARVPRGAPVVLLNHRPDLFDHASHLGIALMLAGHTHGGQIAMPWITGRYLNPSRLITPYDRGLFVRGRSTLYTNCGLGVTAQRVRICTPREIGVFRLRRAA